MPAPTGAPEPEPARVAWVPGPAEVVGIAALGAAAGAAVLFVDWPFPAEAAPLTGTGAFALAAALACAMTGIWAVAVLPLVASLRAVWPLRARGGRRLVVSSAVLALAALALFVAADRLRASFAIDYPLPHREAKVAVLTLLGGGVAGAAVFGMVVVHEAARRIRARALDGERERDAATADLLVLRERLQHLLTVAGAVLGAGVLAAAALRDAVLATDPRADFPAELVLLQGLGFSLLLALAWAPVHAGLGLASAAVRDAMAGPRSPGESWLDWHGRRAALEDVVGVGDVAARFRSGVAIFAPLAGSLLGLLLGP